MASSRFSDIMTPTMMSDRGDTVAPVLATTVSTGEGKRRPRASITSRIAVETVGGVMRFRMLNFLPVNMAYCQVKNRILNATSATALYRTAMSPKRARQSGRPRKVQFG